MNYAHEFQERRESSKPLKPVVMPKEARGLDAMMVHYLLNRRLSPALAYNAGWYPADDNGTPRLVIPASTLVNTWCYYQARAMSDSPIRYKSPAAPRGDALVIVHPEGSPKGVLVVEGPMDALAGAGEGYVGVALMGNKPSEAVLEHLIYVLKTFAGEHVVLPDKDAFEEGAALAAKLWSRGIRCHLKQIRGAKDLAELSPIQRSLLLNGSRPRG